MAWFESNCSCTESFDPEHVYKLTGKCVVTGEDYSVEVKGADLFRFNRERPHMQDCFPYLSDGDREFLISGTSPDGWGIMFAGFGDDSEESGE